MLAQFYKENEEEILIEIEVCYFRVQNFAMYAYKYLF